MKKVLILYSGDDKIKKEEHKKNYELLYEMGTEKGIKFYRGNIKNYYKDKFKIVETFKSGKWIKEYNIKVDVVIDKCVYIEDREIENKNNISKNSLIINNIYFNNLFGSKFLTYLVLGNCMPKTFLAFNKKDLIRKIGFIRSDKIVIKPDKGIQGRGVFIINKNKKEIKQVLKKRMEYPVVVQEFIDSRSGFKGIAKGIHDFRIMFIDHKPVLTYIREPVGKSLVANVSLGGKRTVVDLKRIPKKLERKYKRVLNKLKMFENAIYSIDFIFNEKQKPFVVEINSSPSFHLEDKKHLQNFYKKIIKLLINIK